MAPLLDCIGGKSIEWVDEQVRFKMNEFLKWFNRDCVDPSTVFILFSYVNS